MGGDNANEVAKVVCDDKAGTEEVSDDEPAAEPVAEDEEDDISAEENEDSSGEDTGEDRVDKNGDGDEFVSKSSVSLATTEESSPAIENVRVVLLMSSLSL
jgi:hypothetical protein